MLIQSRANRAKYLGENSVMEEKGCNVSMVQSAKIKEYGKTRELTLAMVCLILTYHKFHI